MLLCFCWIVFQSKQVQYFSLICTQIPKTHLSQPQQNIIAFKDSSKLYFLRAEWMKIDRLYFYSSTTRWLILGANSTNSQFQILQLSKNASCEVIDDHRFSAA